MESTKKPSAASVLFKGSVLWYAAILLVWVTCSPRDAAAQLVFETEAVAAEADYFEGLYDDALSRVNEALAWLKEKKNRDLLISLGRDYSVQEGFGLGLRAQILAARGDFDSAKSFMNRAKAKLADRRTYYIKQGSNSPYYWLYEAFLDCAQGDIEYDQYVPPDVVEDVKDLPARFKEDDKRLERCRKHYEKALDILEDPRKGGGVANPAAKGDWIEEKRVLMAAKINMSLGRIFRLMAERQGDDSAKRTLLRRSHSYYQNAEQRVRTLPKYDTVIDPNTKYPISLKAFDKVKEVEKDVDRSIVEGLKHDYARIVINWVHIKCDLAELMVWLADTSQADDERATWTEETDGTYSKIADLCVENFREHHPVSYWVKVAHIRFQLALARKAEADCANLQGKPLEQAKNRARAYRLNAEWRLAGIRELLEKQLSICHPLVRRAVYLQFELIADTDPKRDPKRAALVDRLKQIDQAMQEGKCG
jgi:tetratricopeptide (TPR) repeat protein